MTDLRRIIEMYLIMTREIIAGINLKHWNTIRRLMTDKHVLIPLVLIIDVENSSLESKYV